MSDDKPIGWWLRHVDSLIEASFDEVLTTEGIGRRHWQLLNAVGDGAPRAAVVAELAPFWPAADLRREAEVTALLHELAARGWMLLDGADVVLTGEGAAARERIGAVVAENRRRIGRGVTVEDYRVVLDTLRRMADNLTCPA